MITAASRPPPPIACTPPPVPRRSPAMPARRSTPPRRALILAVASLLIIQSAAPAWAWGRLGQRVSARLAERQLSAAARAAIAGLLKPGESLADRSTRADEHRWELPKS